MQLFISEVNNGQLQCWCLLGFRWTKWHQCKRPPVHFRTVECPHHCQNRDCLPVLPGMLHCIHHDYCFWQFFDVAQQNTSMNSLDCYSLCCYHSHTFGYLSSRDGTVLLAHGAGLNSQPTLRWVAAMEVTQKAWSTRLDYGMDLQLWWHHLVSLA